MNKATHKDGMKVAGFFRLQVTEDRDGKEVVVGDTGFVKNNVTNDGIRDYLVDAIIGNSPLGAVSHMALGTGAEPATNATSLAGEITHATDSRKAVTTSIVSSNTAQFTAAFNSSDSFVTAAANISNIGLFNTLTTQGGTILAGQAYASSSLATNQNVNATYQIRFTSA